MKRQDFRTRLGRLRVGITFAWLLNWALLVGVIVATSVVVFLPKDATNENVLGLLLMSSVWGAVISAIVVSLVSHFSFRLMLVKAAPNSMRVESGPVFNVVEEAAIAGGMGGNIPEVYIADDPAPNAFAIGGKRKSVVVFTSSLVSMLSREELKAVAAHEVGHIIAGDSKMMTKLIVISSIVGFFSGTWFRVSDNRNGGNNPLAIVVIVLSFIFLLIAPLLSVLAQAFMSRKRESQADALSVKMTRNPSALASALLKIDHTYSRNNFSKRKGSHISESKQLAFFGEKAMRTHPKTEDRVKALEAMGAVVER